MNKSAKEISAVFIQRVWYSAHPLRYFLLPLSALVFIIVGIRRLWFRCIKQKSVPIPIIIVGNLVVGGSGKTPLVEAIVERLKKEGYKPGIVSRGYGARRHTYPHLVQINDDANAVGDEPLLLKRKTDCPVVIDSNRHRGVLHIASQTDIDIAVCDDGLQHYRLHRDIEIAVVDGVNWFGNGLLLPAGPLREPISRLKSVDILVVNGTSRPRVDSNDNQSTNIDKHKHFSMQIRPLVFRNLLTSEEMALDSFSGQLVHACAGIAHPQRFFDQLNSMGARVIKHIYPDHHRYSVQDIQFEPTAPIVVTEKDAVKCERFNNDNVWSLQVEAVLDETFWHSLNTCLLKIKNK